MTDIPLRYSLEGDIAIVQANERLKHSSQDMFASMQRGATGAGANMARFRGEIRSVDDQMALLARRSEQAFNLIIAGVISRGVRELADYTDQYKALTGQIAVTAETEAEVLRVRERLIDIANETRTDLSATGTLYGRLTRAVEKYGYEEEKRLKFTEIANKAAKVGQNTTQEQVNGLIQLSQAIGSNRLQGDELRSVMENLPVLAAAIAEGMGHAGKSLYELRDAGVLTAESIVDAILKMEDSINESFLKLPPKLSEGLTTLNNSVTEYIGKLDESRGYSSAVGQSLISLAENMDTVADGAGTLALVLAGVYTARKIGALTDYTFGLRTQYKASREAAAAALEHAAAERVLAQQQLSRVAAAVDFNRKLGVENAKDTAAYLRTSAAAKAATDAHTQALRNYEATAITARRAGAGLLSVFGGLPGLIGLGTIALSGWALGLFDSKEATETATDALDKYLERIDRTTESLRLLTDEQLKSAAEFAAQDQRISKRSLTTIGGQLADRLDDRGYEGVAAREWFALNQEIKRITPALKDGTLSADALFDSLARMRSVAPSFIDDTDNMANAVNEYADAWNNLVRARERAAKLQDEAGERDRQKLIDTDVVQAGLDALANAGGDSDRRDTSFDNMLERIVKEGEYTDELRAQNKLLEMRLSGQEEEAELIEARLRAQQQIGGETVLEGKALDDLIRRQMTLRKEIKKRQDIDKQEESYKKRLAVAEQDLDVQQALLAGDRQRAELLEMQYDIMREFPDLTDAQRQSLIGVLRQQSAITRELKEQAEAQKELEKRSDFFFRSMTEWGSNIGDIFENSLKRGIADGLAEVTDGIDLNISSTVQHVITNLTSPIAQAVIDPIKQSLIDPVMAGLAGGIGLDLVGAEIGSFLGPIAPLIAGFGIDYLLADLIPGVDPMRSAAGGLIGGLVGGPIGAIAGFGIGALSSVFSSAEKAGTTIRTDEAGRVVQTGSRSKGDGDESVSRSVADGVASSITQIASQLGGQVANNLLLGEVGYRKDEFFFDPTADASLSHLGRSNKDRDTQKFDTAEEAATAALVHALRSGAITGLPDEVMAKLRTVTAANLEQVLSDIDVFQSFGEHVAAGLDEIRDPLAAGLEAIMIEYERAVQAYQRVGADVADVNEYYLQTQERFIEQYRMAGTQLLTDFLVDLTTGRFAGLSAADQLANAREAFLELRDDQAEGDDLDDQSLIEAANAFLEASLAVNAFTGAFFEDRALVEQTIGREIAAFNDRVEETLTTADLIQPLDTIADLTEQGNDILNNISETLSDLNRTMAGLVTGGGRLSLDTVTRVASF